MSKSLKNMIQRIKLESDLILSQRLDRWLLVHPDWTISEENAERLKQMVMGQQRDRSGSFSGSAAGQCPRKQMFDFLGIPSRPLTDTTLMQVFANGTWVHMRWQMMLLEAELIDDIEVALPYPNDWRLMGSMDGTGHDDKRGEFIWEHKGWSAVVEEPLPYHVEQIHRYMLGSGIYTVSMTYEHKMSQTWREFIVEYDGEIGFKVESELNMLNDHVDAETLPEILHACANRTGQQYKGCAYRHLCLDINEWDDAVPLTIGSVGDRE